jgi:hypothetical protein
MFGICSIEYLKCWIVAIRRVKTSAAKSFLDALWRHFWRHFNFVDFRWFSSFTAHVELPTAYTEVSLRSASKSKSEKLLNTTVGTLFILYYEYQYRGTRGYWLNRLMNAAPRHFPPVNPADECNDTVIGSHGVIRPLVHRVLSTSEPPGFVLYVQFWQRIIVVFIRDHDRKAESP